MGMLVQSRTNPNSVNLAPPQIRTKMREKMNTSAKAFMSRVGQNKVFREKLYNIMDPGSDSHGRSHINRPQKAQQGHFSGPAHGNLDVVAGGYLQKHHQGECTQQALRRPCAAPRQLPHLFRHSRCIGSRLSELFAFPFHGLSGAWYDLRPCLSMHTSG